MAHEPIDTIVLSDRHYFSFTRTCRFKGTLFPLQCISLWVFGGGVLMRPGLKGSFCVL